jgi:hypothetical protein
LGEDLGLILISLAASKELYFPSLSYVGRRISTQVPFSLEFKVNDPPSTLQSLLDVLRPMPIPCTSDLVVNLNVLLRLNVSNKDLS